MASSFARPDSHIFCIHKQASNHSIAKYNIGMEIEVTEKKTLRSVMENSLKRSRNLREGRRASFEKHTLPYLIPKIYVSLNFHILIQT